MEKSGKNTELMEYGLFHGLNTIEQETGLFRGLRLMFVYWCFVLFVISVNQARTVTQSTGNTGRFGAPHCQIYGYSHYGRCGRPSACFRCGQSGHMKRDCPLNVSRPTYGTTAPSSIAAPAHTTGSVAQPMGRERQARVHSLV